MTGRFSDGFSNELVAEAAARFITGMIVNSEVADALEDMGQPHVVLFFDPETELLQVIGPYEDGAAAARAAVEKQDFMNRDGDGLPFVAWPSRLWPAKAEGR